MCSRPMFMNSLNMLRAVKFWLRIQKGAPKCIGSTYKLMRKKLTITRFIKVDPLLSLEAPLSLVLSSICYYFNMAAAKSFSVSGSVSVSEYFLYLLLLINIFLSVLIYFKLKSL